ncbi:HNH endonuclease [Kribbella steppae]|uniref:HNH endonuclease n=1 Tax=Kribbella steppae TaxID=2512223 RepID=A0A4V2S0V0_9ACTN|nr:HNH endonuclease signature motif containing protein [Kribbella steppae]TCO34100.1 HNH endonuclease [Kribbella steppae]
MSDCPVSESVSEPAVEGARPSRAAGRVLSVVPEPARVMSPEESAASLARLRERVRRDARLAARHGLLARYDDPDDPDRGTALYEAVVFQDTSELTDSGWLDRLEAVGRLEARLAALKAEAIAGHDAALNGVSADLGHRYPESGDRAAAPGERRWVAGDLRSVADEVALVLQLSKGGATVRIHTSCQLVHNFPATLQALSEGELTERAAFTIVRELSVLEDLDDIRAAESALLEWARKHPLQRIKQQAQREAARRDPAARSRAHARAMEERSVRIFPTSDGTAELVHTQDAIDAAAVMTSLDRAAAYRRRHGDSRTLDQLRADIALARLLPRTKQTSVSKTDDRAYAAVADNSPEDRTAGTDLAGNHEARTGESDAAASDLIDSHLAPSPPGNFDAQDADAADDPDVGADTTVIIHATGAELRALINGEEGTGGEAGHHGTIPQNSLRKHLIRTLSRTLLPGPAPTSRHRTDRPTDPHTASTVRRVVAANDRIRARIDVRITDEPPDGNPDTYTPTAAVDRYVRLRDRTCQFPGCNRPAEFADLDHRTAFAEGGRTTTDNLHCLCRHHHRLKHQGGWIITPNLDGTTTWKSPTGRCYRTPSPGSDPPTTT